MSKRFASGWGKPTGALADYMNAKKGTILLGDIQAHMIKEHSKPTTRRQDVVHPSEVAKSGWCPRSTYQRIKACREASDPFLKAPERIGVQLLNIFDEGHYIHDKWQKRLWDMGLLKGQWECRVCKSKFNAVAPKQCLGSHCRADKEFLVYREVGMRVEELNIYGHADGGIPSLKALIEIKSVGTGTARIEAPSIFSANSDGSFIDLPGLWKAIDEPFPSHIRQGQLYLWICQEMGLEYDKIIFLYESKFNQGAKEFVVNYDYAEVEDLVDNIRRIANALGGNGEDCEVCCHKNLPYPFLCECDDPIKCPFGSCKDCEIYDGTTSGSIRVGNTDEAKPAESERAVRSSRVSTTQETRRRSSRVAQRPI